MTTPPPRDERRTAARKWKRRSRSNVSLQAPQQTVKKGEAVTAVVETSCGTFEIALDTSRAPKTVNSFVYLAKKASTTASPSTASSRVS